MTKLVDRMERAGLVERRDDAGDRRRTLVFETARGRRAATRLLAQAKMHERRGPRRVRRSLTDGPTPAGRARRRP